MNNHAGWGPDGLCVFCGANSPSGECDPRAEIDRLRSMLSDCLEVVRMTMACPDDVDTQNALYDARAALEAYFANDPRKH